MMANFIFSLILGLLVSPLDATNHKIQILLTNPRSLSTAFERSIIEREDHIVLNEPWTAAMIYRLKLNTLPLPQEFMKAETYEGIKALIYRHATQKPVFVKDLILSANELLNDLEILSDPNIVVTLLIRDPALSIESFFLVSNQIHSCEKVIERAQFAFHYDDLYILAERHHKIRGKWPIIIDAEDLCKYPDKTMKAFCTQAEISYMDKALSWKPINPKDLPDSAVWQFNVASQWHIDVVKSEGFFVPKRECVKHRFSSIPKDYICHLEKIYQAQKPFYEKLKVIKQDVHAIGD